MHLYKLLLIQNFAEAEEAYLQVLKLDSKCPDAKLELTEVRVQRLMVS